MWQEASSPHRLAGPCPYTSQPLKVRSMSAPWEIAVGQPAAWVGTGWSRLWKTLRPTITMGCTEVMNALVCRAGLPGVAQRPIAACEPEHTSRRGPRSPSALEVRRPYGARRRPRPSGRLFLVDFTALPSGCAATNPGFSSGRSPEAAEPLRVLRVCLRRSRCAF